MALLRKKMDADIEMLKRNFDKLFKELQDARKHERGKLSNERSFE